MHWTMHTTMAKLEGALASAGSLLARAKAGDPRAKQMLCEIALRARAGDPRARVVARAGLVLLRKSRGDGAALCCGRRPAGAGGAAQGGRRGRRGRPWCDCH